MSKAIDYANERFPEFLEQLKSLVRIPSVSLSSFPKEQVQASATAVASLLRESGFENVEVIHLDGAHPYVYGDWLHAPGKPTLLLYAHHDVQPPGKEHLWKTPPFEPTVVGERMYARGSADDKAGIIVHTSAVASYLKTFGKLPVNVKIIIEGEEEIGSDNLGTFLSKYKEKLRSDILVITDVANFDVGIPAITNSLRGLVAVEVEVRALKQSIHSGSWGGGAPDPVLALSKMLASLVDAEGRIAIPGIYEQVRSPSPAEMASIHSLHYSNDLYASQVGLLPGVEVIGGKEPPLQKLWRLPSLAVNAIEAGNRKKVSNIVNESAWCKIGIRTVPDMNAEKTKSLLIEHLKKHAPWGVEVEITPDSLGPWWLTTPDGPVYRKAQEALTKAFGRECVFIGQGGSIPFVNTISDIFGGIPSLLVGVEDPYTNAHSENESVHIEDLKKAVLGAIYMYEALGAQ